MHAGSAGTESANADHAMAMSGNEVSITIPKPYQPEVPSSQPIEKTVWIESQQSMDNPRARPRKASFVQQPIFQSANRQKTAKENVQAGGNTLMTSTASLFHTRSMHLSHRLVKA